MSQLKSLVRFLLPRRILPHRILAGPLQGSWIVTSWHDYPAAITGRTEKVLLEWFNKNVKSGETWLDIGAHYGYTMIALSRLVGISGRIFAFEPHMTTAGSLAATKILNDLDQVTIFPFALAEKGGIQITSLSVDRGMVDKNLSTKSDISILTTSLDWLWPMICNGNPLIDGIKIDVQGMELEVLRGMFNTIKENKPKLIIEFHPNVVRREILTIMSLLEYSNVGIPIDPCLDEIAPGYFNNHSYLFSPSHQIIE